MELQALRTEMAPESFCTRPRVGVLGEVEGHDLRTGVRQKHQANRVPSIEANLQDPHRPLFAGAKAADLSFSLLPPAAAKGNAAAKAKRLRRLASISGSICHEFQVYKMLPSHGSPEASTQRRNSWKMGALRRNTSCNASPSSPASGGTTGG
eukprot:CAMPEP_0115323924 /NCGR_PEP_ID=MMETSP0270-20121206/82201_1 /TAXON_ID=71861 /ORGANISM="Scrippsiella trochoidea, Strain CCMP3099" /LENGTH=151 /DNA_ID=CAMNT_0002744001 /DNA_START=58 /DNA_END=510 /DNA_ORIENTATION=-